MDVIVARQGALDVHKAQVTACVQVPGADGARVQEVKQFKTTGRRAARARRSRPKGPVGSMRDRA